MLIIIFLLLVHISMCQPPLYEHRGVQYATHGTDFWFCIPRTIYGNTRNIAGIYIMSEHNCTVSIRHDRYDYVLTKEITNCHEINTRLDTLNFIELPWEFFCFADTLMTGVSDDRQVAAQPQWKGFHLTSTDTICAFLFAFSRGNMGVTNLLPTEMLRDEYVVQSFADSTAMFQVVATEDNTTVDITLNDYDWLGRPKDSVVTVTLNQGQIYNLKAGKQCVKYTACCPKPPAAGCRVKQPFAPHMFDTTRHVGFPNSYDSLSVDITGTYIKARDCKRIAVFQGNHRMYGSTQGGDLTLEQAMPIRYAGMEFVVPSLARVDGCILFTGLVDGTTITVMNTGDPSMSTRTLSLDARESEWLLICVGDGPFYITANHPILVSLTATFFPSTIEVLPVEWWHNGFMNGSEVFWTDDNNNGWSGAHSLHVFTRTSDIGGMYFNRFPIDTLFRPIAGTPYSYAYIDPDSPINPRTAHTVENRLGGTFWVVSDVLNTFERIAYHYSHIQPGKNYLEVNDVPADSLPQDSIWCMYDPIRFHGWVERPADSIIWDFGDGNVERYRYEDGQRVTHTYADTGRFEVRRIIKYMDEALDTQWGYVACKSAFTMPSDTMYAHLWVRNHYDSTFAVTVCEGPFTFRGYVMETTDTHYVTTYWTESGCDTLWRIAFTTCPHCSFRADTISDEQLPWYFNGISFSQETRHYPVYIDIGEECDSIIDYYLIVIPHWGEPPIDSTFILAPNIITPNSDIDINRRFHLFCSEDVVAAEVYIFDRVGRRLAHFDGLKEDWDCTYDGKPLPQGAYAYYVRYIDGSNRNWKTMAGTFTIVR